MLTSRPDFTSLLSNGGIEITDEQYARFYEYAKMLVEWNEKINLTAITDPEGIALKHFYDSVYPFTLCEIPKGARVIDVGTGAGFPSCPLKIVRGDISLTLLDEVVVRLLKKFLKIDEMLKIFQQITPQIFCFLSNSTGTYVPLCSALRNTCAYGAILICNFTKLTSLCQFKLNSELAKMSEKQGFALHNLMAFV